jgi:hypothetical protein
MNITGCYCFEIQVSVWSGVSVSRVHKYGNPTCDALQFDAPAQFAVADVFSTTTNNIFNRDQIIRSIKPRRLSPASFGCKAKRVKEKKKCFGEEEMSCHLFGVGGGKKKKCEGRICTLEESTVKRMNTILFTNRSENIERYN